MTRLDFKSILKVKEIEKFQILLNDNLKKKHKKILRTYYAADKLSDCGLLWQLIGYDR